MAKVASLEGIEKRRAKIAKLHEQIDEDYRNLPFVCDECGHTNVVKDTVITVRHWYTSPHGCTGGDYWNAYDKGQFTCNQCRMRYDISLKTVPARYFKQRVDVFDK